MGEEQPIRLGPDHPIWPNQMWLSEGCVDPRPTENLVGGIVDWIVHEAKSMVNLLNLGLSLCRYLLCDWDISLSHITFLLYSR